MKKSELTKLKLDYLVNNGTVQLSIEDSNYQLKYMWSKILPTYTIEDTSIDNCINYIFSECIKALGYNPLERNELSVVEQNKTYDDIHKRELTKLRKRR